MAKKSELFLSLLQSTLPIISVVLDPHPHVFHTEQKPR